MKITCSAAFSNTTWNILQLWSYTGKKQSRFKDRLTRSCVPMVSTRLDAKHKESFEKRIGCEWDIVGHHCVRLITNTAATVSEETGWGWHFSLQSAIGSTNIALVFAFYSQDCSHGVETLLAVHHHHLFGFTICPQFTHECTRSDGSSINWTVKPNLAVPAQWTTPQMLTDSSLAFPTSLLHYGV